MKNNWKKVNLGKLLEYCSRGISPSYTESDGVVVLNQKCIRENKVSFEQSRLTDPKKKKISEEKRLKEFDILVNSTGVGTLGRVAQFKGNQKTATVDSHVTIVRPDKTKILPEFLGYVMFFRQNEIENMGTGATGQTELSRERLKDLKIIYPENFEKQQKIASVLSAYDDLIENNNRQIKVLEEMAQRIYEEWFVNFRFPNHKKVKIKNGIPEGWETKRLEDIADIISRGPSLKYVEDGGVPVLNQRCVREGEIDLQAIQNAEELSGGKQFCYLREYDILINSMGVGTLGRISRNVSIGEKMIIHNCITFVRANDRSVSQVLLYYLLKGYEKEYELLGVGATGQTSLQKITVQQTRVSVPDKKNQIEFNNIILPMWKLVGNLKKENNNLRKTRDSLLPKLMSGEVEV